MRLCTGVSLIAVSAMLAGHSAQAKSLTVANILALHAMGSFSALGDTASGKAALAANLQVTGDIQSGAAKQPTLLPFAEQQQRALRDAAITFGNGRDLADGLGSKLGAAYQALTSYPASETCKPALPAAGYKSVSPNVANLIVYTATLTGADSNAGKYFFSNGTLDGNVKLASGAAGILTEYGGAEDVFGTAYDYKAGSKNADPFGDSRPFQTEPHLTIFQGADYYGVVHSNQDYLTGPVQCLQKSPSFPSGHTTYAYTESLLLAFMVPERFPQMITRGAEYGNSRIIMGAHYAMDVIAGRSLAYDDVAHLLAENPDYVGQSEGKTAPIVNYATALNSARADLRAALAKQCSGTIAACAGGDTSRFANVQANAAFYESTQSYGLPVVYPERAGRAEDVAAVAPEAGFLLQAAFPELTLAQADDILTRTEGAGGGFLDNGSAFGVYSRLDLYRAALQAAAREAAK